MSWFLWLWACSSQAPMGPAQAYVAAAASGDPAECATIGDPELVGECTVFAVEGLAEGDQVEAAAQACSGLPESVWRDECWFTLSDTVEATGEQAMAFCGAAGRFEAQCFGHTISRDSRKVLDGMPIGAEVAAFQEIRTLAVGYIGTRMGTARARQNMSKALAARFRVPGQDLKMAHRPFDPEVCGQAPPDLCRAAYIEVITFQATQEERDLDGKTPGRNGDFRLRQVCQAPDLQTVMAQGFPGWTTDGEELALQAWDQLCKRRGDWNRSRRSKTGVAGEPPR